MKRISSLIIALLLPLATSAQESLTDWKYSGKLAILTTPDGAELPEGAVVEGFPLLVRIVKDWFDFAQAKADGADLRFATTAGEPLKYEIEDWNTIDGSASIWVRLPTIKGNAQQMIQMFWGNANVASESNGKAVFNDSNGYVSVWHLGEVVRDEVGTLESDDKGTTLTAGMIGKARNFPGKAGVFGGEKISNYPSGGSAHTTSLWFRAKQPNGTIIGWGNEGGGRGSKVRMQFRSPPHIHIDSDFSDIKGESRLPMNLSLIHI